MSTPIVAVMGGTGDLGYGLALRWTRAGVPVRIGSRREERAREAAGKVREAVPQADIQGFENAVAARAADIVVLSVPASAQVATLEGIRDALQGKIVVDAIVPLQEGKPTRIDPPAEGSAAERTAAILGEGARLVAGFHTISAHLLQDLSKEPEGDALLCGDDPEAKSAVAELAEKIGLRPIDCGPLWNAQTLERLTPLIIGLNKRYRRRHIGIQFIGI